MRGIVLVPALCVAGLGAEARPQDPAQQTGDAVADAARKARESKKEAPKPKKVYTDDDVKRSAPEPAAAPATAPVNATETTAAQATGEAAKTGETAKPGEASKIEEGKKTEDPNGEAAWRKRFQVQHEKIAKAEKELDILSRELEKAQVEYYPDPQKAMAQQNTRADINTINGKIDAKKKELDQLKQGLDDMEDRLRKSGGDPGWAR
jgi:predicted RNase H-like nuclease (RuvC/YqgF family)